MSSPLPDAREMIRTLVGTPSVSSTDPSLDQPNQGVIDHLATWAEGIGFEVEVVPVPGVPGKVNLVARRGDGPDGLVLSGHTDTVPYDQSGWDSDPFEASERDGRVYGLGTADMKSFLALALHASTHFTSSMKRPLTIIATADEETSMAGARALRDFMLDRQGDSLAKVAVIGEPTGLKPMRAHKGMSMHRLVLSGRSGHSSNPGLGASALDGMTRVLGAITAYRDELQRAHRDPAFEVPEPTLNLGSVQGGDAPNRICGRCELQFDLRLLPGMDHERVLGTLRERVDQALQGSRLQVTLEDTFAGVPAFATSPHSEMVQAAQELTGSSADTIGFATEGPFLQALGLETIILGPGSIDVAHQPNEYLPLAAIPQTVDLLARLINRFCVDGT